MKFRIFKYFHLRRADRVAFLAYLLLIVAIGLGRWFFAKRASQSVPPAPPTVDDGGFEAFLRASRAADSARAARFAGERGARRVETFPFDPNTADSATFVRLGLAPWQARNALKYRRKGGRWRSAEDFARLYGLSREDFERLRPFIRIRPEAAAASRGEARQDSAFSRYPKKLAEGTTVEMNTADTTLLKQIPGIGSYYARKICRYRDRLGGFVSVEQIKEVGGLPEGIERWFRLDGRPEIRKVDVNKADFRELVRHPYLSYEQTKVISEHIRKFGPLSGWEDLRFYKEFNEADFRRLSPYFSF